jgi:hypothetical protein
MYIVYSIRMYRSYAVPTWLMTLKVYEMIPVYRVTYTYLYHGDVGESAVHWPRIYIRTHCWVYSRLHERL